MNADNFRELIINQKKKKRPLCIAHRGVSSKAPGNSMTALRLGLTTKQVDGIEFDVQETKDHKLIVRHHRAIECGNKYVWVKDVTLKDIRSIESSEKTPLLSDVLEALKTGNKLLDIEIKVPGIASRIIDQCKNADVYDRVIFTALYPDIHNEISTVDNQAVRIFGYPRDRGKDLAFQWWTKPFVRAIIMYMRQTLPRKVVGMMKENNTPFVSLYYQVLTPEVVNKIHEHNGICLGVTLMWYKDVQEDNCVRIHDRMFEADIDGIKTDFPQLLW